MALITDIRAPQRGSRLREIVVDGEPFRTTSLDVIRALGLRAGTIMPPEELAARLDTEEPRIARERALRLLGYRDRSSTDLRARLVADGFTSRVAADVVADLSHVSLVDDDRYAASTARNLTSVRGFGRSRARRVLLSQGVDAQTADRAVSEALPAEAEEEAARSLARALARRPDASTERVATRLARRGYPTALALRLAQEAVAEAGGDDMPPDLPLPDD